jgi:hypothetical protein
MRFGICSERICIHLHEVIYDAHYIPDQCHSADHPETPMNITNGLIVHRTLQLPFAFSPGCQVDVDRVSRIDQ